MEGRHEQLLVYNMVAREKVVLAEYTPFSNMACAAFSTLATHASTLVSSSTHTLHNPNGFLSFTSDNVHTFHFLIQDEFRFVVISDHLTERKIAFTCLERMKSDFYKCYMSPPNNDSSSLTTHALQKEFRPKLKHHMEYCLDHFQKLQKLPSLREQVQEVKEGVLENINKVHESQIRLQIDELEVLQAQAENFVRQGEKLHDKMWKKQARIKLVVVVWCRGSII
ncbi:hypothetical protein GOP47_0030455 [Adiantum capillus-veneris]|nr:hypothetical protein GOP47_0030455 [Adiantum capillus-veneris]